MDNDMTRRVIAEFFGTLWLVLGGCGAAVLAAGIPNLGIGFLGAYTTFSTLMFESMDRIETGGTPAAFLNLGGSVAAGMVAVYAGLTLGRTI